MKRKHSRLAEVEVQSSSDSNFALAGVGAHSAFTDRLHRGASVVVPAGFDPDELLQLLVVIQEAMA